MTVRRVTAAEAVAVHDAPAAARTASICCQAVRPAGSRSMQFT